MILLGLPPGHLHCLFILEGLVGFLQQYKVESLLTSARPCHNLHYRAKNGTCLPCKACPKGQQPSLHCHDFQNTVCELCPLNKWSDVESVTETCNNCTAYSTCPPHQSVRYCAPESDSTCDACGEGQYYYEHIMGCKYCTHCEHEASPCTLNMDRVCLDIPTTATTATTATIASTMQGTSQQNSTVSDLSTAGPVETLISYSYPSDQPKTSSSNVSTITLSVSLPLAVLVIIFALVYRKCGCPLFLCRHNGGHLLLSALSQKTIKALGREMAIVDGHDTDPVSPVWNLVIYTDNQNKECFQDFAENPPKTSQQSRVEAVAIRFLQIARKNGTTVEDLVSQLLRHGLDRAATFLRAQLPERQLNVPSVHPMTETQTSQPGSDREIPVIDRQHPATNADQGLKDYRDNKSPSYTCKVESAM